MIGAKRQLHRIAGLLICLVALWLPLSAIAQIMVKDVRSSVNKERTRFVFDLSAPVKYKIFSLKTPDRLVVDIEDGQWAGARKPVPPKDSAVKDIRLGQHGDRYLRFVFDLKHPVRTSSFNLEPLDVSFCLEK